MFNKRFKSSSLVEVIVSLVIFTIIFGIVVGIVFRLNGKKDTLSLDARNVLNQTLIETKQEATFVNETIEENNFTLIKEVSNFDDKILKISIKALRNDKKIDEVYELVQSN